MHPQNHTRAQLGTPRSCSRPHSQTQPWARLNPEPQFQAPRDPGSERAQCFLVSKGFRSVLPCHHQVHCRTEPTGKEAGSDFPGAMDLVRYPRLAALTAPLLTLPSASSPFQGHCYLYLGFCSITASSKKLSRSTLKKFTPAPIPPRSHHPVVSCSHAEPSQADSFARCLPSAASSASLGYPPVTSPWWANTHSIGKVSIGGEIGLQAKLHRTPKEATEQDPNLCHSCRRLHPKTTQLPACYGLRSPGRTTSRWISPRLPWRYDKPTPSVGTPACIKS